MNVQCLARATSRTFHTIRKATGFAVVFAAFSGTAFGSTTSVPEFDPGAVSSALALFIGGLFLMTGRLGRK